MSNYLVEQFPDAVEVMGEVLEINPDFRVGLQIMADFESGEFTQEECVYLMLKRLYVDSIENRDPDFVWKAIAQATKFLNCGDDSPPNTEGKPRTYSFSQDAKYIYSAFSQAHGVDLQKEDMHWWRFVMLFNDLGECTFNTLRYLRSKHAEGDLSDHEKKMIEDFGSDFYLEKSPVEDILSEEELYFISLLPEDDQKRFWEGRKK